METHRRAWQVTGENTAHA